MAESPQFTGLSDNGDFLAVLKPDGDSTVRLELWQVIDSQRQLIHQQDGIPASINRAVARQQIQCVLARASRGMGDKKRMSDWPPLADAPVLEW